MISVYQQNMLRFLQLPTLPKVQEEPQGDFSMDTFVVTRHFKCVPEHYYQYQVHCIKHLRLDLRVKPWDEIGPIFCDLIIKQMWFLNRAVRTIVQDLAEHITHKPKHIRFPWFEKSLLRISLLIITCSFSYDELTPDIPRIGAFYDFVICFPCLSPTALVEQVPWPFILWRFGPSLSLGRLSSLESISDDVRVGEVTTPVFTFTVAKACW